MEASAMMMCCASCGKTEGKLKTCTACKSVKYCSVDCQRNHRKVHKKECKRIEKALRRASCDSVTTGLDTLRLSDRAAEEKKKIETQHEDDKTSQDDDEDMFTPPPKEECPLCLAPLPIRDDDISYESCCGKILCDGCVWKHDQVLDKTNAERALDDPPKPPLQSSCAFCRKPTPTSTSEALERVKHRMALGDPEAFDLMGSLYRMGAHGLARDDRRAFELRHRAAELGSASACFSVSVMYGNGIGVERDSMYQDGIGVEREVSKEEHYLKIAAKKGHILARHNLGSLEGNRGNIEVAVKHWMISATAGLDDSVKNIAIAFREKNATKDQYETAIRLCKDAKEEMSSEERDKAKAARASGLM